MGINGGIIYQLTNNTRIGMHYRNEISHKLKGDIKYKNLSPIFATLPGIGNRFINQNVTAKIDTPSTFSISLNQQLNDTLTLLTDVTYTKWSNFQELKIEGKNGAIPSLVEEKWNDSYRLALGLKYQYNPQWIIRTGIAHDETPIDDKYRTSRIPGDDRNWLSFGASYSPSKNMTIDLGYSHLWVNDAQINEEFSLAGIGTGTLKGDFNADVNILSIQATFKFK
jgi:long-chain fatty acid transport protein